MVKASWYDPQGADRIALAVAVAEAIAASDGGGGGVFPDFSGEGSPQGVIEATKGKTYVDTANGTIYIKVLTDEGHTDTGWTIGAGVAPGPAPSPNDEGTLPSDAGLAVHGQAVYLVCGPDDAVVIADSGALDFETGTFNGLTYQGGSSDGNQSLSLQLGATGEAHQWSFNPEGTLSLPGDLIGPNGGDLLLVSQAGEGNKVGMSCTDSLELFGGSGGSGIYLIQTASQGQPFARFVLGPHVYEFNSGDTLLPGQLRVEDGDTKVWAITAGGEARVELISPGEAGDAWLSNSDDQAHLHLKAVPAQAGPLIDAVNSDGDPVFTVSATGDLSFGEGAGPIITDQSDGHTYRIICTAGVLSTVQVS